VGLHCWCCTANSCDFNPLAAESAKSRRARAHQLNGVSVCGHPCKTTAAFEGLAGSTSPPSQTVRPRRHTWGTIHPGFAGQRLGRAAAAWVGASRPRSKSADDRLNSRGWEVGGSEVVAGA
jgi:hypothetical protein